MFRRRLSELALLATLLLCACKSNEEPAQASDAAFPPCTESWCATMQPGCDKFATLCYPGLTDSRDAAVARCVDELGVPIRSGATTETPAQFADCMDKAKTCNDAFGCTLPISNPQADGGAPPTDVPDAGWSPPSSWDPLPGDDPACVECAAMKCPSESPHCFERTMYEKSCIPDGGTYADCCNDYRRCLAECRAGDPDGGVMFTACAAQCDKLYPGGQKEFAAFQTCMTKNCSTCGSTTDGGSPDGGM